MFVRDHHDPYKNNFETIHSLEIANIVTKDIQKLIEIKGTPIRHPSWSPDGKWIAYVSKKYPWAQQDDYTYNKLVNLYVVNIETKEIKKVIDNDVYAGPLSWLPDSERIMYVGNDGIISTVTLEGTDKYRIIRGRCPRWSPDGKKIAYIEGEDIYVTDSNKIEPLMRKKDIIVHNFSTYPDQTQYMEWSPDGRFIIYHARFKSSLLEGLALAFHYNFVVVSIKDKKILRIGGNFDNRGLSWAW